MRHEAYKRLTGEEATLLDLLYYPGADQLNFDPPRFSDNIFRVIDST